MRVLVTGGTGFVGCPVVQTLSQRGHNITLLVRNERSVRTHELNKNSAPDIRTGNVLDPTSVRNACTGVDAVVHLVGIISEVGKQTFERVHIEGTQNAVNAARSAGARRFLHMSALGTRPDAVARYHKSKWAAEEIVRNSGLDWTIFRPSIIYGADDAFVNRFATLIRFSPVVPVIGNGRTKFQPIPIANVASAFAQALTQPESIGQTYDLAGPEVFTFDELIDTILQVMRRRRLKLHLPFALASVQAALLEFLYGLLHRASPLNPDQVLMLEEDNVGNPAPANVLFGLKSLPFTDGIASYLR
jgi:NADH dehydrogenase